MNKKIRNAEFTWLEVINAMTKKGVLNTEEAIDLKTKIHSLTHTLLEKDKIYDSLGKKKAIA